ncbi:MAG: TIGR03617 family F420-dependent LLM class oxidoreductase [Chloroflexi bacterium]|nr:TIGR03617 family F420-dependent LLM class oxidoreductase [Chloroflexota bacterium]
MKVVGHFGDGPLEKVPEQVKRLERLGFDVAATSEVMNEATMRWTLAAHVSTSIEVSTHVIIAFPRSPFVLAQMAWELQRMTGGRISIGLGSQVKGHNERRFSTGMWRSPARRMEDYIRTMRAVWATFQSGELVPYEGEFYNFTLCPPAFNMGPNDEPTPKVYLAAVGPEMTKVAGRVADGLLPHAFTTSKYVHDVTLPTLRAAAISEGRDPSEIEISAGGLMALGMDEDAVEQELHSLRSRVAFYGSTRTYHGVFAAHGLEDLGVKLHEMSVNGQWEQMPDEISPDVVREFTAHGTFETMAETISNRFQYASRVSLPATVGSDDQVAELVKRVKSA